MSGGGEGFFGYVSQALIEQRVSARILGEHGRNFREQSVVSAAGSVQKDLLLGWRQDDRVVEHILNSLPAFAIHRETIHHKGH